MPWWCTRTKPRIGTFLSRDPETSHSRRAGWVLWWVVSGWNRGVSDAPCRTSRGRLFLPQGQSRGQSWCETWRSVNRSLRKSFYINNLKLPRGGLGLRSSPSCLVDQARLGLSQRIRRFAPFAERKRVYVCAIAHDGILRLALANSRRALGSSPPLGKKKRLAAFFCPEGDLNPQAG